MDTTNPSSSQGRMDRRENAPEAPRAADRLPHKQRIQAVSATFRNILLVVFLIFVFAVVQTFMLWRVCNAGMKTATSLDHEGLPTLNTLASLQEHIALYRLYSYEYLFAREGDRAAKAKAATTVAAGIRGELTQIETLLPGVGGRLLSFNLEAAVNDLDAEFLKVRSLVDSDFGAAMKEMDQNVPAKTEAVSAAAAELKDYGYDFSTRQANATFGSFGWIKDNAVIFGAANILVAFGAVLFVLLAARRSSAQLSETLARLDRRTDELQQTNGALQTEIVEHERIERALCESEERFRTMFESSPLGIFQMDEELNLIYANEATCAFFGRTLDELRGSAWREAVYAEDRGPMRSQWELMKRNREPFHTIRRYCRKDGQVIWGNVTVAPIGQRNSEAGFMGQLEDVTGRMRAELEMREMNKQLMGLSRQAGMAEVATSVLHNVGNVLNSVNTSASLVIDKMRKSQRSNLGKVAAMLDENSADLGGFLTNDSKGKKLPAFIRMLSQTLVDEQETVVRELESLSKHIDHIKDIVSMQQSYAKISGVAQVVEVVDLVEDSLSMNAGALARHDVELVRDFQKVPPINVDKHKVLQILVNLIRNAKYACDDGGQKVKRMTVRVANGEGRIKISISDNGIGIPAENLTRIFNHGFTTRKQGHGFGLHGGALAAKELGGTLLVHSDGHERGATFTLELPVVALPQQASTAQPALTES